MAEQKVTNVTWHDGEVSRADRQRVLGQKGVTLWFTGLSASGKSTIAVALEKVLNQKNKLAYHLDGDNIRHGINANLGFTPEDRTENIRRIGEIAKLFVDTGIIVLSSFISPYRQDRDVVRRLHDDAGMDFLEIFLDCPLDIVEARDPKGLYKKARAGEIKNFTGIDAPYEAPLNPELVLKTAEYTVADEVDALVTLLSDRGYLQ
jgi:adenylylsulfate kinase